MFPKLVSFLYALESYWYITMQEQRCQRVDNGLFKAATTVENDELIIATEVGFKFIHLL
jgi:hypothetical protein